MFLQDIQTNRVLGPFQAVIAPGSFEHLIKKIQLFYNFSKRHRKPWDGSVYPGQSIGQKGQRSMSFYNMCINELSQFFSLWRCYIFLKDIVRLRKKFQNKSLQPIPWNNDRVVAPIVQNACYRCSSWAVRGRELKLLPISSVHLKPPSIISY